MEMRLTLEFSGGTQVIETLFPLLTEIGVGLGRTSGAMQWLSIRNCSVRTPMGAPSPQGGFGSRLSPLGWYTNAVRAQVARRPHGQLGTSAAADRAPIPGPRTEIERAVLRCVRSADAEKALRGDR